MIDCTTCIKEPNCHLYYVKTIEGCSLYKERLLALTPYDNYDQQFKQAAATCTACKEAVDKWAVGDYEAEVVNKKSKDPTPFEREQSCPNKDSYLCDTTCLYSCSGNTNRIAKDNGVSNDNDGSFKDSNYYTSESGLQVITIIEDFKLGFHLGNVIKYVLRAGKKDKDAIIKDLNKAVHYLKRYTEKLNA